MKYFFTLIASLFISLNIWAQCTPDPTPNTVGIYPSSTLQDACVNAEYTDTITIVYPLDTTVNLPPPITIPLDSAIITDVLNLPVGLNYTCGNANCTAYPQGQIPARECLEIWGTPTNSVVNQSIGIEITAYATVFGNMVSFVDTSYISITINGSSSSTISPTACGSYTSPSGNYVWTSSNTYMDTIPNVAGCDSVITVNLTINPAYNNSETVSVCRGASYTFPDGSTQNNITAQVVYTSDLLTVSGNCDSIITTTVNVNPTYHSNESASVCSGDSYTFPDGSTQTNITAQVVYTSDLLTVSGSCDSIITTTVDVNPTYHLNESASVCSGDSYTFPDGSTQTNITAQVVYTSDLLTVSGNCDSIITTTVDVNPTYHLNESASVCSGDSYTFPDGSTQTNITAQVVYTSDLLTVNGNCDSIIVTTVDVNPIYNLNETVSICPGDSYIFPDGSTQTNITAQVVYTSDLLTVSGNCDSIITTTVNVNPTYNLNVAVPICTGDNYTFPDGSTQTNITTQVVQTSDLQTVDGGCDSIITTTLNVSSVYNLSETVYVCSGDSFVFPDASVQTNITAQVVHTSNLQATGGGCDSIIVTTVEVDNAHNLSESATICSGESYTFPDGSTQSNITAQVVYTSNLQTQRAACDSIIVTTVDVNPTYMLNESATVCEGESYTFPDGSTQSNITAQVVYTSDLLTVNGSCDSIITTTVDVSIVDTSVTQNGNVLTANGVGVSYMWLDCNDNYSPMPNGNALGFVAPNGRYAVALVNVDGCVDTSGCHTVITVGVENELANAVHIYPNPTKGTFKIDLGDTYTDLNISIRNVLSQEVNNMNLINARLVDMEIDGQAGIYFVELSSANGLRANYRVVKE